MWDGLNLHLSDDLRIRRWLGFHKSAGLLEALKPMIPGSR